MAVPVDRQHLRMRLIQPQGRGRGRGGEIDGDAGRAELADDAVQPVEVPFVLGRLDPVPAEDRQGDRVDAGLGHQANVVVPDGFGPLIRVVVAAVGDAVPIRRPQGRPPEGSARRVGGPTERFGL